MAASRFMVSTGERTRLVGRELMLEDTRIHDPPQAPSELVYPGSAMGRWGRAGGGGARAALVGAGKVRCPPRTGFDELDRRAGPRRRANGQRRERRLGVAGDERWHDGVARGSPTASRA